MRAEEARKQAEEIRRSGVNDIIEKIKVQALKGEFGLSISDYTSMNEQCRKALIEMGYSVRFQETQRDDGYWQINW